MKIKKLFGIVIGLCLIAPVMTGAYSKTPPHKFYGTVKFADNATALDGTKVQAKIDGKIATSTVTKDGKYGYDSDNPFHVTNSNNNSDAEVQFFVNGLDAESPVTFSIGKIENLNLLLDSVKTGTITKGANDVISTTPVVIVPDTPTVIEMGDSLSISLTSSSSTNTMVEKVEKLRTDSFTGAMTVISGNNLLNGYEISITGNNIAISVTMKYDDSSVDESTIKPYQFDGAGWVAITPFTIDNVDNTLTFSISSAHTPYAVFGETVEASASSSSTAGGNGGGGGSGSSGSSGGSYTPSAGTSTAITGDINGNSVVDKYDFALMMSAWGKTDSDLASDLNDDGKVDKYDFSLLMVNWSI